MKLRWTGRAGGLTPIVSFHMQWEVLTEILIELLTDTVWGKLAPDPNITRFRTGFSLKSVLVATPLLTVINRKKLKEKTGNGVSI